jgi:hypothetical protein
VIKSSWVSWHNVFNVEIGVPVMCYVYISVETSTTQSVGFVGLSDFLCKSAPICSPLSFIQNLVGNENLALSQVQIHG